MNNGIQLYRLKYRLPINHSMDGSKEKMHHHVIEIEITFRSKIRVEGIGWVGDAEKCVDEILGEYRNKFINDIREFEGDSTIENMGEVFFKKLNREFTKRRWLISRFEISETPLRVYAIVLGQ